MKIVHVVISCFYREGFGYQENIITRKHLELGLDVSIVTVNVQGKQGPISYINDRGVEVHVLESNKSRLLRMPVLCLSQDRAIGLYEKLEQQNPDIIFAHGIYCHDYVHIIKYKKQHPHVRLIMDNHADYYNSSRYNTLSGRTGRFLFMGPITRKLASMSDIVWGVTPWRVKFLTDVYHIPENKVGLLVMGGDESKIDWENRNLIKIDIRKKYNIPENAFLVITGGKIDKAKNITMVKNAIEQLEDSNIYLLVFGKCEKDMDDFPDSIRTNNIKYIGWIPSDDVYSLYLASDLGIFPGTHSVLWEQACACGLPCIFKDWDGGFSHVDVGGNCVLMKDPDSDKIKNEIVCIVNDSKKWNDMKETAQTKARQHFSYIRIAKQAIGLD